MLLFDRAYAFSEDLEEYTEAGSGDWLGQSRSRGVTFVSPGGAVFGSEAVGEFDLLLPSGELVMEESGDGDGETALQLPQGEWRARWSGFGEAEAETREHSDEPQEPRPDRYLLQLWPLRSPGPVARLRGS